MNQKAQIKQAIKDQATRQLCQLSFFDFFRCFWHTVVQDELVLNWHLEFICNELQIVGERIIARQPKEYDLIINVPPGESKSTICTVLFPVWLWVNDPSLKILTGSYAGSLSTAHSIKSRDCLRSDLFKRLYGDRFKLRTDIDAKSFYANTSGGERQSISTGSAVTGSHGHIIIVDDPLNPKQAASAAELASANRWFFETLPTRKTDKAIVPTILIMQRLAENDVTGAMIEKGINVKHICIPGEKTKDIKPAALSKNYKRGIMNPARNGRKVLNELKKVLGSRAYAAQILQQPAPAEGNILKKDWFVFYKHADIEKDNTPVNFYIDSAYTKKDHNDPSALMAYKVINNNLYVTGVAVVRLEFPELCRFTETFAQKNSYSNRSRIHIEPKASGKSLAQMLKRTTKLNIVEDKPPKDSKVVRVTSISPIVEAGRVMVPEGEPWVENFIDECAMFPNAKHDDQVDCLHGSIKNSILHKKGISTFIST